MKVVILAGGKGTRLSDNIDSIPKPMVKIGNLPILCHIMNIYSSYGFNDFIIALGHKSEYIKEFFLNYIYLSNNFTINFEDNTKSIISNNFSKWKVSLIDTGESSQTGGRLLKLKNLLDDDFMMTYGDGLSNVNINKLLVSHKESKKLVTVTAVRPTARFGELIIDEKSSVTSFQEKPQIQDGWINGGFFVMKKKFLDYIDNDQTVLEQKPLEDVVKNNELFAYKHDGFWQCMDTLRDKDYLNSIFITGQVPPWLNND